MHCSVTPRLCCRPCAHHTAADINSWVSSKDSGTAGCWGRVRFVIAHWPPSRLELTYHHSLIPIAPCTLFHAAETTHRLHNANYLVFIPLLDATLRSYCSRIPADTCARSFCMFALFISHTSQWDSRLANSTFVLALWENVEKLNTNGNRNENEKKINKNFWPLDVSSSSGHIYPPGSTVVSHSLTHSFIALHFFSYFLFRLFFAFFFSYFLPLSLGIFILRGKTLRGFRLFTLISLRFCKYLHTSHVLSVFLFNFFLRKHTHTDLSSQALLSICPPSFTELVYKIKV